MLLSGKRKLRSGKFLQIIRLCEVANAPQSVEFNGKCKEDQDK